ncbi:unnamed protein product [Mycena citricolor]|uniref:Uncharacterized protein n=1 Tax=Mycena citricolor TaxID=2018698 RepID=A0AAD2HYA0_9AGAR|nr:unnamed protein product [Mycena citricolor]
MAPTSLPIPECSCDSGSSCAVMVVLFMLVFYALALWDRWMTLKLRQHRRDDESCSPRSASGYGTMEPRKLPPFQIPVFKLSPPPPESDPKSTHDDGDLGTCEIRLMKRDLTLLYPPESPTEL